MSAAGMPGSDAPLTADTFTTCASVIESLVRDEIPVFFNTGVDAAVSMNIASMQGDAAVERLPEWLNRALDGDPALLAGIDGVPPWAYLRAARSDLGDAVGVLESINGRLAADWTGAAADTYASYMLQLRDRVKNHVGETPNEGYLAEVAALTEAAFALAVAYKKDLLELARGAATALDGMGGGSGWSDVGVFCLALGGLALGGLGAVAAGSAVVGTVFAAGVASTAGGYVFGTAADTMQVGGGDPEGVVNSLADAAAAAESNYAAAAKQVSGQMDALLQDLAAAGDVAQFPTVPAVDITQTGVFLETQFFPKSADGQDDIEQEIENLPNG